MSDNVSIKDFNGNAANVMSDEVTHPTFGTGQVQVFKQMDGTPDSSNMQVINSAGEASVRTADVSGSASLAVAGATNTIAIAGTSSTAIQVSGTFSGTLTFEGTVDGSNWVNFYMLANGASTSLATTTTPGVWTGKSGGYSSVRVRFSTRTSGTAVCTIRAGQGTGNVAVDTSLPAGTNAIGSVSVTSFTPSVSTTGVFNPGTAIGSTVPPVRIGAAAFTTNPAAVASGTVQNIVSDKLGRLVTVSNHVRDMVGVQATTITSSTAATTIVTAPGASVFADITHIDVSNGSATPTSVTLSDGTVSMIFNVPAGGGFVCDYTTPLKSTTANVAWTLACGTSVASVYCNVVYVKNL